MCLHLNAEQHSSRINKIYEGHFPRIKLSFGFTETPSETLLTHIFARLLHGLESRVIEPANKVKSGLGFGKKRQND
jgi:hypothetical protein